MAITCSRCGAKQGIMAAFTAELRSGAYTCPACSDAILADEQQKYRDEQKRSVLIKEAAKSVIVTTTPKIDGYYVVKYIGIESVEFVIGTGAFSEVSSSIADFFGARSSAFEQKLQAAKRHAMGALKYLAAEQGANAVVGVDLDYTEFSGNRIALIINGTLVQLAPVAAKRPNSGA